MRNYQAMYYTGASINLKEQYRFGGKKWKRKTGQGLKRQWR